MPMCWYRPFPDLDGADRPVAGCSGVPATGSPLESVGSLASHCQELWIGVLEHRAPTYVALGFVERACGRPRSRLGPYASARCVYWIVDNGSSHRGRVSIARLEDRYTKRGRRRLHLIHCPGALIVAEPVRDLLLRDPAQGAHPQRLRGPGRGRTAPACLRAALQGRLPPRS